MHVAALAGALPIAGHRCAPRRCGYQQGLFTAPSRSVSMIANRIADPICNKPIRFIETNKKSYTYIRAAMHDSEVIIGSVLCHSDPILI